MLELAKIPKLRRQLGLTQTQLASISDVSQSLIAKIESGNIDPSYSKVTAIISCLENLQKRDKKLCKDIMSSKIVSVSSSDLVSSAAALMRTKDISQLPVFENDKSVGSISDTHIIDLLNRKNSIKNTRVGEIMHESFPILPSISPANVAIDLLRYYKAILLEKNGSIVGILTKADLLKSLG